MSSATALEGAEAHSAVSATPKKTARFNEFPPQDIPDLIR
jgi:hypothetical protein